MTSAAGRPAVGRALPRSRAWGAVICLWLVAGLLLLPATPANAATLVVSTTADAGPGSLRQAIASANATPGVDIISFNVGGGGPQTISPLSPLPAITGAVVIDGLSQPGADCGLPPTFPIRLDGSGAGSGANGLTVSGGTGSTIEGLTIGGFAGDGISLSAPATSTSLMCVAIGTSGDGTASFGNGGAGIAVRSTGSGNTSISGNVIRNNGGAGVLVDAGARHVSIHGNRIDANGGIGIDLVASAGSPNGDGITPNAASAPGAGGNDLALAPVLASAVDDAGSTTVDGTLTVTAASTPANTFEVEFFASPACDAVPPPGGAGEGARSIGSVLLPESQLDAPGTVSFTATGLDTTTVGDAITATATDGFGSGNTSEFSACVPVKDPAPPAQADLSITKQGPAQVTAGSAFSYAIGVSNAGPADATGVTVTDALPAGVSFVAATPNGGSCSASAGTVTCALGALASGANATIDLSVKADPLSGSDPKTVSNTASVTSDLPDPNPADDTSAAVVTTVVPARGADLELTSVANMPNPVTGGYDLGYAVVVTNLGPGGATHVALTDTLAPGESFVGEGSDPRCTASASLVTCALGSLDKGTAASVLIVTQTPTVAKDSSIQDGFAASAAEDTTPANDQKSVTTTVVPRRTDFAAGYVPARRRDTWITDATFFVHGDPMATMTDTTVGAVMVPGGGPGGPVTITEGICRAPFACSANTRTSSSHASVVGALVTITVPRGYGPSNAFTGVFLDNWSVIGTNDDRHDGYYRVAYLDGVSGAFRDPLPGCRDWGQSSPPCIAGIARIHSWWNPYADGDLWSTVRFTGNATFGRER